MNFWENFIQWKNGWWWHFLQLLFRVFFNISRTIFVSIKGIPIDPTKTG
jgi:hypothetical protein